MTDLDAFLASASVDTAVKELRPDYRALLIAVDGIAPGPSDERSEGWLVEAEEAARNALSAAPVEELPHVAAWRDAYRAFGAKPQRTRNSLEALLRRVDGGLPRIGRLADLHNAVSVKHQIPLGGEDFDHYVGAPRLIRAVGTEPFDTTDAGQEVVEHPEAGEVVWCDEEGVTCRRWNWRQGRRTRLTDDTRSALFILDALDPLTDDDLRAAGDELIERLTTLGLDVRTAQRLV